MRTVFHTANRSGRILFGCHPKKDRSCRLTCIFANGGKQTQIIEMGGIQDILSRQNAPPPLESFQSGSSRKHSRSSSNSIAVSGRSRTTPYGSLVPRKEPCQNLFARACVSSAHIAFDSIRMEPGFMILSPSAATAAHLAIDDNIPVQDVDYKNSANGSWQMDKS